MKKIKIWAVFFLIFIMMVSGCSKPLDENQKKQENQENQEKQEMNEKNANPSEMPEAYAGLLEEYHQFILHFDHSEGSNDDFDDSKSAIWEMLLIMQPQEILKEVGYGVMDMNKDNVPELVIGDVKSEAHSMEMGGIYALFTLKEEVPHLILTGNPRDKYFYLGEGEFANQSANIGDYYLSLFKLNKGETTLEPKGLYALPMQESSDVEEKYYYSESNEYDLEHAQELKKEEFDKALETIRGRVVKVEYTPFSEYKSKQDSQQSERTQKTEQVLKQDRSLRYDSHYKQAAREYKKYYDEILSKYDQFLSEPIDTEELNEDMRGVFESYTPHGAERIDESVRSRIGYNLIDVNADKIPELMIGNIEKEQGGYHYGSSIHALYTIIDGKVKSVFSSSLRDSYFYLGNDKFYNTYLETDGYQVVTVFVVDDKTGEYRYIDYYYSERKEANSQEFSYFHNKFDDDVPLSKKEYDEIVEKIEAQIKDVRFVPFSDYTGKSVFEFDSIQVQVQYSTKEEIEYAYDYDGFNTEDKDAVMVTFTANDMTKDFKILHLKNVEVNENGKMTYEAEEAYHQEVLDPSRPFIAGLYFYGSIPNNGISYVNEDGDTVTLFLQQSGEDGSLYLQQLN